MEEQKVLIDAGALAVLVAASERFLHFGRDLFEAGTHDIREDLDVLSIAIQVGRHALGKEEEK